MGALLSCRWNAPKHVRRITEEPQVCLSFFVFNASWSMLKALHTCQEATCHRRSHTQVADCTVASNKACSHTRPAALHAGSAKTRRTAGAAAAGAGGARAPGQLRDHHSCPEHPQQQVLGPRR